jgi:hypothetical protein
LRKSKLGRSGWKSQITKAGCCLDGPRGRHEKVTATIVAGWELDCESSDAALGADDAARLSRGVRRWITTSDRHMPQSKPTSRPSGWPRGGQGGGVTP